MKTTDNLEEILDVVDEEDRVIGQATREEVHRNKKLIHRSIGVAVSNDKGELFLQQRSATKDTDPNKWTISCSGHVGAGDDYLATVYRELEEELGIRIFHSFLCLPKEMGGKERAANDNFPISLTSDSPGDPRRRDTPFPHVCHSVKEITENYQRRISLKQVCKYICYAPNETEMQVLYKTIYNGPFTLNKEEITQGKFFTRKELQSAVKSGRIKLSFSGKESLRRLGWEE